MKDRSVNVVAGCIVAVVFLGILLFTFGASFVSCAFRWSDMEWRWMPIAGCQVNTEQGWVPEDRVRVLE